MILSPSSSWNCMDLIFVAGWKFQIYMSKMTLRMSKLMNIILQLDLLTFAEV